MQTCGETNGQSHAGLFGCDLRTPNGTGVEELISTNYHSPGGGRLDLNKEATRRGDAGMPRGVSCLRAILDNDDDRASAPHPHARLHSLIVKAEFIGEPHGAYAFELDHVTGRAVVVVREQGLVHYRVRSEETVAV